MVNKLIYLDNASTTHMRPEVIEAITLDMKQHYANPSSSHDLAKQVRRVIESARKTIADSINCFPNELIFTSGGTESNNLAILGCARAKRDKGRHVVTSKIEHGSVLNVVRHLEKEGFEITCVDVDANGLVDVKSVLKAIRSDTVLVSIMYVNNEIGTIQPIREIAKHTRTRGVVMHTDAVQALGKIQVDIKELGVDFLSISSHKIHGSKGTGILYARTGMEFMPLMFGGHQEQARRPGTENTAGIVGIEKAIGLITDGMLVRNEYLHALRNRLEDNIKSKLRGVIVNGVHAERVASISNVSFDNVDGSVLMRLLNRAKVYVTSGSACESDSLEPSHVLSAMRVKRSLAEASVRFSLSAETTEEEVDEATDRVVKVISKLRGYDSQLAFAET